MNTQEHLQRIKAKCQELLAIAEKRTPGEWKSCNGQKGTIIRRKSANVIGEPQDVARAWNCWRKDGNAAFIASCAGAAEAGWRATIAAIDELTALNDESCLYDGHEGQHTHRLDKLIAAWPQELL
jgi:hypothetical protein